ncbi:hemopexin repeat-containing protein, partial [Nonomuraea rhizosphaerae]|uniref:hemopexin repeat-containing protein n=1 Tax=Nonomuraea rhizosphaerae TaxID=2665663 RepID=UPI001C5EE71E
MRRDDSLPSYEQLFEELDFYEGDEARSVYSPAAYLVDLLRLLEGVYQDPDLLRRRPDLAKIPLDAENTFTESPYLDIVNEVLEQVIGATPYETLREADHPFTMPFSLDEERFRLYLRHFKVGPDEFYRLFAAQLDADLVARLYLGLSAEEARDAVTPNPNLRVVYGLGKDKNGKDEDVSVLNDVDRFRRATGLTMLEVRELILQSEDPDRPPSTFFVNRGSGTAAVLDEQRIVADVEWFERTNRFVRLARKTGLTMTDLDRILTTCCDSQINLEALRSIAVVVFLGRAYELAVDGVCGFVVPIKPADLEDLPAASGDILAPHNKDFRRLLARSIEMAESDIVDTVLRFREHYSALEPSPFDQGEIALAEIALLQRVGRLVTALGLSVGELFDLLEVLESDPSLQRYTTFSILGGTQPRTQDCYRILEGADPASALWLAQTLFAVAGWMQTSGFSAEELIAVLGSKKDPEDEAVAEVLRQRFEAVALTADLFVSRRFGQRASQALHDVLTADDVTGVVSAKDDRLLRLDKPKVRSASYDAVTSLGLVLKEDFLGLGLDERLTAKIFANLVFSGRLQADGTLVPTQTAALVRDFGSFKELLFKLVNSVSNGTSFFYPSDLASLGNLTEEQQAELYDNLVHHGYLDSEGAVLDPDFFADETNVADFKVNADLDDVAPQVLAELQARIKLFKDEPLTLDPQIFAAPELDVDVDTLLRSLRFNGYIDSDDVYVDKAALLALRLEDLSLAMEFYPRRRTILDAMKEQIAAFQKETYTFTPEDFVEIADDTVAQRAIDALEGSYIRDGRVIDEGAELDGLGDGFSDAEVGVVAARIGEVLQDERSYRLDLEAVTALGFDESERVRLLRVLIEAGHLDQALTVPEDRVAYFRNANNALDFELPGLEDYAKELFFLLHPVAKEIAAAVDEITVALEARATQQREALWEVLADALGIPAATVEAICVAVTGGTQDALDALAAPALTAPIPPAPTPPVTQALTTQALTTQAPAAPVVARIDPRFLQTYRRVRRFALLAAKLALDPTEVAVAFKDQDLVGKYPEPLVLPRGLDRFDALLESADGHIYLFEGEYYWTYAHATHALIEPRSKQLVEMSTRFAGLTKVDAAFTHPATGIEWLIGHGSDGVSRAFTKIGGTWVAREQVWGKVRNTFVNAKRIDSAFVDEDGKTYLFCGDQYVRYSTTDYTHVDEGYPRAVTEWWSREGHDTPLPKRFAKFVDASFQDTDGGIHLFSGPAYLRAGDTKEQQISDKWGKVRNAFQDAPALDAAYTDKDGIAYFFRGNQLARYSDSIENDHVHVDDGYPRRIQAPFESGIEAALEDADGDLHLFRDGRTVKDDTAPVDTVERWGAVPAALPNGRVDSAFTGLDGKTYLFRDERYLRYSTADYTYVDEGYPRTIAKDWGGLRTVGASFVMDGMTYLFGEGGELFGVPLEQADELKLGHLPPALRRRFLEHGLTFAEGVVVTGSATDWHVTTEQHIDITLVLEPKRIRVQADAGHFYVRYSTRNYATPDAGFPKPVADNWWNLPTALAQDPAWAVIDAVLTGRDNQTYLFSGGRFVVFDHRHRWWSEPRTLATHWDSLPSRFHEEGIDAAFIGKDGRTYLFSKDQYVRYSTADYTQLDDRYPATVGAYWGNVLSNLERTGRVDATLVMDVVVDEVPHTYTYLFSGSQYLRFEGTTAQPGYPRNIRDLAKEPGLGRLTVTLDGVDAAFADQRNVYLFRGGNCHVVSIDLYRRYDNLPVPTCAFIEDGSVLIETGGGWHRLTAIEGRKITATPVRPRTLRAVPQEFRTGLDAVLTGADGTTYLFQGPNCYNTRLNRQYPLTEEWARPRNTIYQDNRVDAAFVGQDGKTYLFSGDQFVTYTQGKDTIDGDPRPIADHWAGLTSVALAYVRDGKTYVFEKPDESEGTLRLLVYSGDDYTEPDDDYPAITDSDFWEIPDEYRDDHFARPDAVLFEGHTMLLLYGDKCVQQDQRTGQWSYPRPIERIWRGFDHEPTDRLRTAFTATDGATYFFFDETYTRYADRVFSPAAPIRDHWGRSLDTFLTVDAAVVAGEHTFLFSGDKYVRYTGGEYRYVDPGYPKKTVGNLRQETAFANLGEELDRPLTAVLANRRNVYAFTAGACHVASTTAEADYDLGILGGVRNTIPEKVDAALVKGRHTYLFSGDQYVRYTGTAYDVVDDGYPRTIDGSLATDLELAPLPDEFADGLDAAFRTLGGRTYLFKGGRFLEGGRPGEVSRTGEISEWGVVDNAFATGQGVDAAFAAPTGEMYVFKAGQYLRYQPNDLEYVETGYPRTVKDDWGDLPKTFEDEGPDAAFVLEGRTYFFNKDQYVRYTKEKVERTFPQQIKNRWSDTADYRLSDLHTIVRFLDLARSRPDGLAAFLHEEPVEDPYRRLADLFGWDVDELRWARRNAELLTPDTPEEDRFEIEFVLRLAEAFKIADRFASGLSTLHADVWTPAFGGSLGAAGTALYTMLERRDDWATLEGELRDELNLVK